MGKLQLAEDVADVGFDRLLADEERLGDFPVCAPMSKLTQHGQLSIWPVSWPLTAEC